MPRRLFTCLFAATALQGCAFTPQLTNIAMDHDLFVADTNNQKTARNILRAKERQGLSFTRFSQITGTFDTNANIGLNTTIAGASETVGGANDGVRTNGANSFAPSVGVSVETGSNFNIAVDESEEFQRGISTPIEQSTIVYFLSQGWPPELISHLMLERITVTTEIKFLKNGEEFLKNGEEIGNDPFTFTPYLNDPDERGDDYLIDVKLNQKDKLEVTDKIRRFDASMRCRTLSTEPGETEARGFAFEKLSDLSSIEPSVLARVSRSNPSDNDDEMEDRSKGNTSNVKQQSKDETEANDTSSDKPGFRYSTQSSQTNVLGISQPRDVYPKKETQGQPSSAPTDPDKSKDTRKTMEAAKHELDTALIMVETDQSEGKAYDENPFCVAILEDMQEQVKRFVDDIGSNPPKGIKREDFDNYSLLTLTNVPQVLKSVRGSLETTRGNATASGLESSVSQEQSFVSGKGFVDGLFNARCLNAKSGEAEKCLETPDVEKQTKYEIKGDITMSFGIRSTQSVIYYLGEYLRAQDKSIEPKLEGPDKQFNIPIVRFYKEGDPAIPDEILTRVSFNDVTYLVPSTGSEIEAERGRTSQVIALVNELLNLHRSSDDLPTTPVVQLLN